MKKLLFKLFNNNILLTFKYIANKILTHPGIRVLKGLLYNGFSKQNELYENEKLINADIIAACLSISSFIRLKVLSINLKTYKINSERVFLEIVRGTGIEVIFFSEMGSEKSKVYAIVF